MLIFKKIFFYWVIADNAIHKKWEMLKIVILSYNLRERDHTSWMFISLNWLELHSWNSWSNYWQYQEVKFNIQTEINRLRNRSGVLRMTTVSEVVVVQGFCWCCFRYRLQTLWHLSESLLLLLRVVRQYSVSKNSCSCDKHGLILITFGKRHQHSMFNFSCRSLLLTLFGRKWQRYICYC